MSNCQKLNYLNDAIRRISWKVVQQLAKSVLIPLGLTAAASAADAGINKKILGSGHNTT